MQVKISCGPVEMVELPLVRDFNEFGGEDQDARNRYNRYELPVK